MQELIEKLEYSIQNSKDDYKINFQWIKFQAELLLEKEKEQIQKAFSDGQETPINHPTLPHYSREEYYNQTYNQNK